jgi:prepilin-type N-terminal cleavage/methylation domain-containing protein
MSTRGFTLLEVVIAIGILALSITTVMGSFMFNIDRAGRARGLTLGTLLAQSKMIDIEETLFVEGFTVGDQQQSGDFDDEGHPDFKWEATIAEVKMEIGNLCGMAGEEGESACGLFEFGGVEGFLNDLGASVRAVALTVRWPEGRFEESLSVRSLVTKDNWGLEQAAELGKVLDDLGVPPDDQPPQKESPQ